MKTAYHKLHNLLIDRGLKPSLHILDNEWPNVLKTLMREVNEKFQLVPTHIHHINSVEQEISNFKEHFISGLASTHKDLPLHIWCQLLPHNSLILNLIWQSRINPKLSGYDQLHGEFNYNATPLAPPDTQIIVHEKPTVRGTWEENGVKGWYLGPSTEHYRCHRVYTTKTRGEHDSDCVDFFPQNNLLPYNHSSEKFIIAAHELAHALQNPAPQPPFSNIGDSQMVAIYQRSGIFPRLQLNRTNH